MWSRAAINLIEMVGRVVGSALVLFLNNTLLLGGFCRCAIVEAEQRALGVCVYGCGGHRVGAIAAHTSDLGAKVGDERVRVVQDWAQAMPLKLVGNAQHAIPVAVRALEHLHGAQTQQVVNGCRNGMGLAPIVFDRFSFIDGRGVSQLMCKQMVEP